MEDNKELQEEELQEEQAKTFTEDEVQALLQKETDKRVSQALNTAKQKWQEEFEAEKSEVEKLAKMSEEERFKAELDREREQFENERKEFLRHKMELQTVKELQSNGLPVEFANYLIADDAETVKQNIENFKEAWVSVLENAVEERLKGKTPIKANVNTPSLTKEDFKKLSYNERLALFQEDPEQYKALTK